MSTLHTVKYFVGGCFCVYKRNGAMYTATVISTLDTL